MKTLERKHDGQQNINKKYHIYIEYGESSWLEPPEIFGTGMIMFNKIYPKYTYSFRKSNDKHFYQKEKWDQVFYK